MKYFARKFGFFLLTLWAVVTLNFLIPRLQPGDPAEIMVQRWPARTPQLDQAQVAGDAGHARRADGIAVAPVLATTSASCSTATSGSPTPTTRSR